MDIDPMLGMSRSMRKRFMLAIGVRLPCLDARSFSSRVPGTPNQLFFASLKPGFMIQHAPDASQVAPGA
jgi:hypothetical protein